MQPVSGLNLQAWRQNDPCAKVQQFAQSVPPGLWLNLLVSQMDNAVAFQQQVLGADCVYQDSAFAIMQFAESFWMLHSESSYSEHPLSAQLRASATRGTGCEIRLQGCNPDQAEERAKAVGAQVLQPSTDKPHAMRECFLVDADGYLWVPCMALS